MNNGFQQMWAEITNLWNYRYALGWGGSVRGKAPHQQAHLSLTSYIMQQHDKDQDKSKHKLANIERENTHAQRCWYGSCV